jgi:hypothetical protein
MRFWSIVCACLAGLLIGISPLPILACLVVCVIISFFIVYL